MRQYCLGSDERRTVAPSSSTSIARVLRATAAVLLLAMFASPAAWAQGVKLKIGDVLVVDPYGADVVTGNFVGAKLISVNKDASKGPVGAQTVILIGGIMSAPSGVILAPDGDVLVVDQNRGLIRVNPVTGAQTLVSSGFNDAFAIAMDSIGNYFVADSGYGGGTNNSNVAGRIIRVDLATGTQYVVATGSPCSGPSGGPACLNLTTSGSYLNHPYGIAVDSNDNLIVSDMSSFNGSGAIIRINNPLAGSPTQDLLWGPDQSPTLPKPTVTQSAAYSCPMSVAVQSNGNILASVYTNFSYGCGAAPGIFQVNLASHTESIFSNWGSWQTPSGMDTEANNNVIVADYLSHGIYELASTGGTPLGPNGNGQLSGVGIAGNNVYYPVGVGVIKFTPPGGFKGGTTVPNASCTAVSATYDGLPHADVCTATNPVGGAVIAGTWTYAYTPGGSSVPVNQATYSVIGSFTSSDSNFSNTTANGSVTISPKAASVTPNAAGKNFGSADPVLTGTLAGFVASDNVTATYSRVAGETPGTYLISATLSASGTSGNYSLTYNTANFTITNIAPVVTSATLTSSTINENGSTTLNGAFTDLATKTHTVTINWGDGTASTVQALSAGVLTFSASHQYLDDNPTNTASDVYTIQASVADNFGGTGARTAQVTVTNVAPVIPVGGFTGPTTPLAAPGSTPVTASVVLNFTDVGTKDTHTCAFTWDDGTSSSGVVTETNGSGLCKASHVFTTQGTYTVTGTITDDDTGTAVSKLYVVVYDPTEGSINGNGKFASPAGAFPANPTLTGNGKFGFDAKYKKGASVPSGTLNFKDKKFRFFSTSYQYLVISGNLAQLKGNGTVIQIHDGAHDGDGDCDDDRHWRTVTGNYTFTLNVVDGRLPNGAGDKVRMTIVDPNNVLIYDNGSGSLDMNMANPQPIISGKVNIVTGT